MTLNSHGAPTGLAAVMGSATALAKVTLRSTAGVEAEDAVAMHQALAVSRAVQRLECLTLQPTAFPVLLRHLTLSQDIKWANRELEAAFQLLRHLLLLNSIELQTGDCEVILSAERMSHFRLPSLRELRLRLREIKDKAVDLSWFSNTGRRFALALELQFDCSDDQLLAISQKLRSVLQPHDSLWLWYCEAICEPAQQVLSGLELQFFLISVPYDHHITRLPTAERIELNLAVFDYDVAAAEDELSDMDDSPILSALMLWSVLTSARLSFTARVFWMHSQSPDCSTHLDVLDAPVGPTAWQQSLARPEWPWMCSLAWDSIAGMPSATSRTNKGFELKKEAAPHLKCLGCSCDL